MGSVLRPKATKKIAANKSLRGSRMRVALWATWRRNGVPNMNAPTAGTCGAEAIPETGGRAEHVQQKHFRVLAVDGLGDAVPVFERDHQDHRDDSQRDAHRLQPTQNPTPAVMAVRMGR